ncbi:PR-1-like protein [Mycena kentingensis (nom. inval.)]|nr:PR-1-like protein [Mycena kentingensis (nom. inval.)]
MCGHPWAPRGRVPVPQPLALPPSLVPPQWPACASPPLLTIALALFLASATALPHKRQEQNGSRASTADVNAYLAGHNTVRAKHGAVPLVWSNTLAAAAQVWADKCVFEHSGGTLGPFGENLAAGSGDFSIAAGVKAWTDEATRLQVPLPLPADDGLTEDYNPANPQPSHFTQVVWKATTLLGCAVAACDGIFAPEFIKYLTVVQGKAQFYVCEYQKQGNVIGAFAENVQV